MLDYARSGELSLERVALGDVMSEVAVDLRPLLDDAGATLVVGALPVVDGDPRQLRRVLQNLIGTLSSSGGRSHRGSRSPPSTGAANGS